MSSIRILPHETVNLQFSDSIKLEEWFLGSRELNKIELGSFNEFDPTSVSQFWRQIMIDPRNLASELLQGSGGRFCITIEVRSEHSKLRYVEAFEEFTATDAKFVLDYEVEIPNIELGGRLVLTTKLVLVKGDPKDPVAALRPGSILGSDIRNYEVEESFDGFPHLEPSNLTEIFGLTPGPNWLVDVDTDDLYVHCTQGLTVNLNADSKVGKPRTIHLGLLCVVMCIAQWSTQHWILPILRLRLKNLWFRLKNFQTQLVHFSTAI
jgi:hypothetical protein